MIGDREKVIGIKPNLVAPVPAEDGGTTHPEVVEGLLQYLQEHGFEIYGLWRAPGLVTGQRNRLKSAAILLWQKNMGCSSSMLRKNRQ